MAKDEENIHAGHRERLLDTVFNVGLQGLSNIQIMEFILFYIFPRGDVNPLAHRLLDKFKNVSTILDASVEDLITVRGMGKTSAKKLKMLVEIFNVYTASKATRKGGLRTFGDIYDYAENLLRYKTTEEFYVFGFDNKGEYVADRCLARGTLNMVGIEMREISNFINTYRVPVVYVAHNHPNGSCVASAQDKIAAEQLKRKFEFNGCELRDNFIVGDDGIYSVAENVMKRIFTSSERYADIISMLNNNDELL